MPTYSNVIKTEFNIEDQAGTDWRYYIRYTKDEVSGPVNWSTAQFVGADVKDETGKVVASFLIGSGLEIWNQDNTYLFIYKNANEKPLPPGKYTWDLLVVFSDVDADVPVGGAYTVLQTITQKR